MCILRILIENSNGLLRLKLSENENLKLKRFKV